MPTPIESIIMAFMMSNGDLNGVWQSLPFTSHACNRNIPFCKFKFKMVNYYLLDIFWMPSIQKVWVK